MKDSYSQPELAEVLSRVPQRSGWDFSRMNATRAPVPWEYQEVVKKYVRPQGTVLDVGTGDGEQLLELADFFGYGLGVDIDQKMIDRARANGGGHPTVRFGVSEATLSGVSGTFDLILDRHAPFDLTAVHAHLHDGGYFVTQQVAESNMRNVKEVLGQVGTRPISEEMVRASPLTLVAFMKYDVEYIVHDIESLVFWLKSLDMRHADIDGNSALVTVETLNGLLENNVDQRGFVTNEARSLVVAQRQPSV